MLMFWCNLCCFCVRPAKRLKLDVVGRVWDLYLLMGEGIVYRTAVAILKALKVELLGRPFDQIMKKLNQVPLVSERTLLNMFCSMISILLIPSCSFLSQDLSEDDLLRALNDVHLTSSMKAKLKNLNHAPTFVKDE
jgi:hypothetical protein